MAKSFSYTFGWLPDFPDIRDYTDSHKKIKEMTSKLKASKDSSIPERADLRSWFSSIQDQENIGSCTAHAVASIVEYFENKAYGKHVDASRLFLYKVTRNLLHSKGDTGAFLKTTLGALVLFGTPPEEYWPYDTEKYDIEPNAFCYAFGQNFQCISYFRHDSPGISNEDILHSIKSYISSGVPSVFGFTVYDSIQTANENGMIPFPSGKERILGGHAVAAAGYDDNLIIKNPKSDNVTKGAILIKNSWGKEWGEKGFGWLPYEYILKGIAVDWWSILKHEWIDSEVFTGKMPD